MKESLKRQNNLSQPNLTDPNTSRKIGLSFLQLFELKTDPNNKSIIITNKTREIEAGDKVIPKDIKFFEGDLKKKYKGRKNLKEIIERSKELQPETDKHMKRVATIAYRIMIEMNKIYLKEYKKVYFDYQDILDTVCACASHDCAKCCKYIQPLTESDKTLAQMTPEERVAINLHARLGAFVLNRNTENDRQRLLVLYHHTSQEELTRLAQQMPNFDIMEIILAIADNLDAKSHNKRKYTRTHVNQDGKEVLNPSVKLVFESELAFINKQLADPKNTEIEILRHARNGIIIPGKIISTFMAQAVAIVLGEVVDLYSDNTDPKIAFEIYDQYCHKYQSLIDDMIDESSSRRDKLYSGFQSQQNENTEIDILNPKEITYSKYRKRPKVV